VRPAELHFADRRCRGVSQKHPTKSAPAVAPYLQIRSLRTLICAIFPRLPQPMHRSTAIFREVCSSATAYLVAKRVDYCGATLSRPMLREIERAVLCDGRFHKFQRTMPLLILSATEKPLKPMAKFPFKGF